MDAIDTKILEELVSNSRIMDTALSKKLQIPRHVVQHRRKRLKEKGIITSSQLILNYPRIGFNEYVLLFRVTEYLSHKEKIAEFLSTSPFVRWAAESFPRYNLRIVVVAKSMDEVEHFIGQLEKVCDDHIVERDVLVARKILKSEAYYKGVPIRYNENDEQVDIADMEFLHYFERKPDATLLELAQTSGLSVEGVRKKIKRLTESGVILKNQTNIDVKKLGLSFWGIFLLQIDNYEKYEHKIISLITGEIGYGKTRKMFGNWNVEMTFYLSDFTDMMKILHQLELLFGDDLNIYHLQIYTERFFKRNVNVPGIMWDTKE